MYTIFITIGPSQVKRNFLVVKSEFRPPKRKRTLIAPIDISLAYLVQIRPRTSIYTRFTSFGGCHV
jgi:hypothetical protein